MGRRIGVLGGMGPRATHYFVRELLLEIESKVQPRSDQEYPDMTVLYENSIPDRTVELVSKSDYANRQIHRSLETLSELGCKPIAVPCITAHCLISDHWFEKSVVDIREVIVSHLPEGVNRIGILATDGAIEFGAFERLSSAARLLIPDQDTQRSIMSLIYGESGLKSGGMNYETCQTQILKAIQHLDQAGADVCLAGCTEVEMFISQLNLPGPMLFPLRSLAAQTVASLQTAEGD